MLDADTKRRIDTARNVLVGKVPDPKSQVEQITIALIYKFMDDMDAEAVDVGGKRSFFTGDYAKYGWANLMSPGMGGFDVLSLYSDAIGKMNVFQRIADNHGVPMLGHCRWPGLPCIEVQVAHSHALHEIDRVAADHEVQFRVALKELSA